VNLLDEFLPAYDVSDAVATVVSADVATTWNALLDADLIQVGRQRPVVAVLGAVRVLPELLEQWLRGRRTAGPDRLRLRDLPALPLHQGGWLHLGCRERDEMAFGLVGRFWRPIIQFADVPSAAAFREFDAPGFAKTVYALSVRPLPDGRTLLRGEMRTATTDEHARRWFRRYWTFGIGSGAHVLVNALLDVTREVAEQAAAGGTQDGGVETTCRAR
jgi:hypothetical protein